MQVAQQLQITLEVKEQAAPGQTRWCLSKDSKMFHKMKEMVLRMMSGWVSDLEVKVGALATSLWCVSSGKTGVLMGIADQSERAD